MFFQIPMSSSQEVLDSFDFVGICEGSRVQVGGIKLCQTWFRGLAPGAQSQREWKA